MAVKVALYPARVKRGVLCVALNSAVMSAAVFVQCLSL